jgi:hypothetical protein
MPDDNDRRRNRSPALGLPLSSDPSGVTLAVVHRAQRDTDQKVVSTLDRVGELRGELTARINQLDAKVDDLALSNARVEGQLEILVETVRTDRTEHSQIRVKAVEAVLEVEKTGEVAKINEAVAVRADRRQFRLRVLVVLGPILASLITLLISRC